MNPPPRNRYRQHLEVETPEHVLLDFELAGIGSRALAKVLDLLLLAGLGVLLAFGFSLWRDVSAWITAIQILLGFGLMWGYFTATEGLLRGRTPGKRAMGVRVIRDTGHGIGFGDAALRNLLLPADLFALIGVFLIALHPRARRLGDLVAGTVVVRDHPTRRTDPPEPATGPAREAPVLGDAEFRLLREFIQRSAELPHVAVKRHTATLVARFAARFPDRRSDDLGFLQTLYQEELARRQGKFAARAIHPGEHVSGKTAASSVERMVARKADRWRAFQTMAERVTRGGLDALSARELPEFATRYREVAADLARARTYGADPLTLGQLERLVAAGHNAQYRSGRNTWRGIADFVLRQCPAAVIQARRYVLLAGTVFTLSAIGGFALLREKPALAPELLPDVVLERAEAGVARTAQGQGYVDSEPGSRPIVASSIITNNIQVAFSCFAGGIFLGVGALVMLAFNGLLIGAISAHFANAGLLGYLYTFVIGHSVLEVFAIWVSGAAGFLLGRALIAPGPLRRADALVIAGRQAVRMVGAAVVILFVAGSIEGFVSAGGYSVRLRLMVGGASVVLLGLYLLNGWKRATEHR